MKRFHKRIADCIGTTQVPRIDVSKSVADAIELMRELDAYCAYVESKGALVGVFTDRDLITRVLARGKTTAVPVEEVMTPSPESLHPRDNVTYAINKMAIGGYRNIPIVDDNGKLVAGLSVRDVISHMADVLAAESEDTPDSEWVDIGGEG